MATHPADDVTILLAAATAGDDAAANRLLPLVYEELRGLAASYLRGESAGHTLPPTALVHGAYLKLVGQRETHWKDRGHFFAVAATAMRRILVNHVRDRRRLKRGGDRGREALDDIADRFEEGSIDLLALDAALDRLRHLSERQARVVELRFFAGLTPPQVAEVTGESERSVHRDWAAARAWLRGEIEGKDRDA
ncbi:MAG: ECF-type sigma factor [Phycisphaerae bacterium]|mgnify:CR=1 FL=1|nr:ECF-type sigma factor [Phycisphaerae bacterium]